jgi:hypothetical protein
MSAGPIVRAGSVLAGIGVSIAAAPDAIACDWKKGCTAARVLAATNCDSAQDSLECQNPL